MMSWARKLPQWSMNDNPPGLIKLFGTQAGFQAGHISIGYKQGIRGDKEDDNGEVIG